MILVCCIGCFISGMIVNATCNAWETSKRKTTGSKKVIGIYGAIKTCNNLIYGDMFLSVKEAEAIKTLIAYAENYLESEDDLK